MYNINNIRKGVKNEIYKQTKINIETGNVNMDIRYSYEESVRKELNYLNIDSITNIDELIQDLKENEVKEFTLTYDFSGIIAILEKFDKAGFKAKDFETIEFKDYGKVTSTKKSIRYYQ